MTCWSGIAKKTLGMKANKCAYHDFLHGWCSNDHFDYSLPCARRSVTHTILKCAQWPVRSLYTHIIFVWKLKDVLTTCSYWKIIKNSYFSHYRVIQFPYVCLLVIMLFINVANPVHTIGVVSALEDGAHLILAAWTMLNFNTVLNLASLSYHQ